MPQLSDKILKLRIEIGISTSDKAKRIKRILMELPDYEKDKGKVSQAIEELNSILK